MRTQHNSGILVGPMPEKKRKPGRPPVEAAARTVSKTVALRREQIEALWRIGRLEIKSFSNLVQEAVDAYLERHRRKSR